MNRENKSINWAEPYEHTVKPPKFKKCNGRQCSLDEPHRLKLNLSKLYKR